ncbi:actin cytoskeleton and mitosis protein, partial [Linderina macrospora]
RVAERLPSQIFLAPIVQQALRLHRLSQTSNEIVNRQQPPNLFGAQNLTTQFFRAIASAETPLLLACLAEYEFPSIRRAGLKAMNSAFPHQQGREYPLDQFASIFAFDSLNDAKEFCGIFNVPVNEGGVMLGAKVDKKLTYREPANRPKRAKRNLRVVGIKFQTMTPMRAINADLDPAFLQARPMPRPVATIAVPKQQAPMSQKSVVAPTQKPVAFAVPNVPASKPTPTSAPKKPDQPVARTTPSVFASNHSSMFQTPGSAEPKAQRTAEAAVDKPLAQKKRVAPSNGELPPISPFSKQMIKPATQPALRPPLSAPQSLFMPPSLPVAAPSAAPAAPSLPVFTPMATPAKQPTTQPVKQPALSMPAPQVHQSAAPKVAEIKWNKPRRFIHWMMLSNAILDNLVESLVRDIAAPTLDQVHATEKIADHLAEEIAKSLVDYTSAFIAYEEAYREVMFAKADAFRKRSLVNSVFSQWRMEVTVRQQEAALRQQYIDDLKVIVDNAPMRPPPPPVRNQHFGQSMVMSSTHSRTQSNVSMQSVQATESTFWDSCQLGRGGFASLTRALEAYGSLPFHATVGVVGAHGSSLLEAGLWWQIDPVSATQANSGAERLVSYSNDKVQRLDLFDETDEFHVVDSRLYARIALLALSPVGDDICRDLCDSLAGAEIAANLQALADNLRGGGGPRHTLLVFWSNDARAGRTVAKMIEKRVSLIGISTMTHVKIQVLDLQDPKHQLTKAVGWVFNRLAQTQRDLLVTSSIVLDMVKSAALDSLHSLTGSVSRLRGRCQSSNEADVQVFNGAVDVVNLYLGVLNARLLTKLPGIPALAQYVHVDESQGELRVDYFIQNTPKLDAVVGVMLDDIFQACAVGQITPLVAHLRALEFTVRHQLDVLQQRVPSDVYLERTRIDSEIADTRLTAKHLAAQAKELCQHDTMGVESPPASVISMQSAPAQKRPWDSSIFAEPTSPTTTEGYGPGTSLTKRTRPAASSRLSRFQEALARAHQQLQ